MLDHHPEGRLLRNLRARHSFLSGAMQFANANRQLIIEQIRCVNLALQSVENSTRLDNYSTIHTLPELIKAKEYLKIPVEELRKLYDYARRPAQYDAMMQKIMDEKADNQKRARSAEARAKVLLELASSTRTYKHAYMIFSTLTVDDEHYNKVFERKSLVFQHYIQRVRRQLPENSNMRYVAVHEKGGDSGRNHLHILQLFDDLPDKWKIDPNEGVAAPRYREIPNLKKCWPYGFSTPIAVRYSDKDAFSVLGWRWPVDPKNAAAPLPSGAPAKIANYMCKYLTKSIEKGNSQWRIKFSRGFGLSLLNQLLQQQTINHLSMLILNPVGIIAPIPSKALSILDCQIPGGILKRQALKEYTSRLQALMPPEVLWAALKSLTPQPSIVLQYKQILSDIGIPKESSAPGKNRIQTAIRRLQSTGLFTTQKLMATDISKARKALRLTIHHLGLEDGLPHRGL